MGRTRSRTCDGSPLRMIEFEHIPDVDEAEDLVDGLFVDGNARELLVYDKLTKIFERCIGRNRDDCRPRRHHLTNRLAAERHDRLDQPPVLLFDDSFLGSGRDQGFDILLLSGWLLSGFVLSPQAAQATGENRERPSAAGRHRSSARMNGTSATNQCPLSGDTGTGERCKQNASIAAQLIRHASHQSHP